MGAKYQGPKIELIKILDCPITASGGGNPTVNQDEMDNTIEDVWD